MGLGLLGIKALRGIVLGHRWLLRDDFCDVRAAGAVDGTPAVPGPGTRSVTDTDGDGVSINGGVLQFANPNSAWGNPGYWLDAIARVGGRVVIGQVSISTLGLFQLGWDNNQVTASSDCRFELQASGVVRMKDAAITYNGPTLAINTDYKLCIVLRSAGAYFFIKGGAFSNWTLLIYTDSSANSPVYPLETIYSAIVSSDFIRVPDELWLPTPLAYDSFTRGDGILGFTEDTGPDGQPSPVKEWEGPTWAIVSNEAVNTPTLGAELFLNPGFTAWTADDPDNWIVASEDANNFVTENPANTLNIVSDASAAVSARQQITPAVGSWIRVTYVIPTVNAGSARPGWTNSTLAVAENIFIPGTYERSGRITAANPNLYINRTPGIASDSEWSSVSAKIITLADLFASLTNSTPGIVASVELDVIEAGTQAGLVVNLDDVDTPANFVIAYHDGTNCALEKCVAGVYTSVISAAAAYAAGATLVVIKDGTDYSLYYNNAQVGTTQTIADAGIINNTLHGMFSTYEGNELDNFQLMARGTGNEYNHLDRWSFDGNCGPAPEPEALLQENNDDLLLESGDRILLEAFN